mmetsp:Transcript_4211/g.26760  ORF Transcript_4211/g.26760 Transcript_4211/m.26760 type:complete len:213 (-) Transcript_4211:626-1264(-)
MASRESPETSLLPVVAVPCNLWHCLTPLLLHLAEFLSTFPLFVDPLQSPACAALRSYCARFRRQAASSRPTASPGIRPSTVDCDIQATPHVLLLCVHIQAWCWHRLPTWKQQVFRLSLLDRTLVFLVQSNPLLLQARTRHPPPWWRRCVLLRASRTPFPRVRVDDGPSKVRRTGFGCRSEPIRRARRNAWAMVRWTWTTFASWILVQLLFQP